MLVVEAREIGLGRLLGVEIDVLDRDRVSPGIILIHSICQELDTVVRKSASSVKKTGSQ